MLLKYGVREDSWESLRQQGDPTSPSYRRSVLNIHWKDWCWSWSSNTLATWWEELTTPGKDPDAGKVWRQEEKGMAEDEMIGWQYWLDGYESEQAPGDGDGQGGLACCSPWGHRVRHDWVTEETEHDFTISKQHLHMIRLNIRVEESGPFPYKKILSVPIKLCWRENVIQEFHALQKSN